MTAEVELGHRTAYVAHHSNAIARHAIAPSALNAASHRQIAFHHTAVRAERSRGDDDGLGGLHSHRIVVLIVGPHAHHAAIAVLDETIDLGAQAHIDGHIPGSLVESRHHGGIGGLIHPGTTGNGIPCRLGQHALGYGTFQIALPINADSAGRPFEHLLGQLGLQLSKGMLGRKFAALLGKSAMDVAVGHIGNVLLNGLVDARFLLLGNPGAEGRLAAERRIATCDTTFFQHEDRSTGLLGRASSRHTSTARANDYNVGFHIPT